jgi:hypothetical protein
MNDDTSERVHDPFVPAGKFIRLHHGFPSVKTLGYYHPKSVKTCGDLDCIYKQTGNAGTIL